MNLIQFPYKLPLPTMVTHDFLTSINWSISLFYHVDGSARILLGELNLTDATVNWHYRYPSRIHVWFNKNLPVLDIPRETSLTQKFFGKCFLWNSFPLNIFSRHLNTAKCMPGRLAVGWAKAEMRRKPITGSRGNIAAQHYQNKQTHVFKERFQTQVINFSAYVLS